MLETSRRWKAAVTLALSLLGSTLGGWALPAGAAYPDKPIRLIVPFPPGGATDVLARVIAVQLGEVTKQTVIVENKAKRSVVEHS